MQLWHAGSWGFHATVSRKPFKAAPINYPNLDLPGPGYYMHFVFQMLVPFQEPSLVQDRAPSGLTMYGAMGVKQG